MRLNDKDHELIRAVMDRYGVTNKTQAVRLSLRLALERNPTGPSNVDSTKDSTYTEDTKH
jgi:Arc/MetJ family transcription regulator